MKSPKRGRPRLPEGDARDVVFSFRLTEDEHAMIQEAAKGSRQAVTKWARDRLVRIARTWNVKVDGVSYNRVEHVIEVVTRIQEVEAELNQLRREFDDLVPDSPV